MSDRVDMRYAMWLLDKAIPNGDCLECHFADSGGGYRRIKGVGAAHRFIYSTLRAPIPEGILVCHECDNPPCIHPDHLFLGTDQDNKNDCVAKNRHKSIKPFSLTIAEELEIYFLVSQGETYASLAAKFRVSDQTIYQRARGLRGLYAYSR